MAYPHIAITLIATKKLIEDYPMCAGARLMVASAGVDYSSAPNICLSIAGFRSFVKDAPLEFANHLKRSPIIQSGYATKKPIQVGKSGEIQGQQHDNRLIRRRNRRRYRGRGVGGVGDFALVMKYFLALVHSWLWHLMFGMWKGYRETKTSIRGKVIALTSTDGEWRIMKVFWTRTRL